jgi:hypothetical protein
MEPGFLIVPLRGALLDQKFDKVIERGPDAGATSTTTSTSETDDRVFAERVVILSGLTGKLNSKLEGHYH